MSHADTIVAIASAAGIGGIGVLRISGSHAGVIAQQLLGRKPTPRYAHYASFKDASAAVIDRGLLLHFPAPHSYTGEHVVELQVHGSPVLMRSLLRRVVELGARQARAGEFSERAFLNGKLDLAQAEAVADLIASGSEAAARAAMRSLDGEFSRQVGALLAAVTRQRVWIEAAIDFPDDDIDFLADARLHEAFVALNEQLDGLLASARRGLRLNNGLHVVIVGRPNAGKSSLLNALAATDRAIVTEVPGTTRDLLRETVELDGIALTLVDTAGLRDATDVVEREGIRRALAELQQADLAVLVTDDAHAQTDQALLDGLPESAHRVVVHNKIDLDAAIARVERIADVPHLWLSARTGVGVDLLVAHLKQQAGFGDTEQGTYSARARHVAALERARTHLAAAAIALGSAGELAAEELRQVQHALGEITGEFSNEDLLGEIFGSFCIGK